ncbi:hypothetical protein B9Z55_022460 [Caenorhabditis nigoni]|nr:hypothetical protein B9Z55_022460 [Caenorhabditis nigoni]
MLMFLALALGIRCQAVGDFKMAIIPGRPEKYTGYQNLTLADNDCVQYCLHEPTCAAVYTKDGSSDCIVFSASQIQKVFQVGDFEGQRVAMKMKQTYTCGDEFEQNSMFGSETTNTSYTEYEIFIGSDSLWTFTVTKSLKCPSNYRLFTRAKGLWCIGLVTVTGGVTGDNSGPSCASAASGAILSGLESMNETEYIYGKRYGIWVDGKRKDSCKPPAKKSAACNGTNEFTYSDPLLSTYAGYQFAINEPSALVSQTTTNCLNLLFNKKGLSGVDDNWCNITNESTNLCYRGMACGLKPIMTV